MPTAATPRSNLRANAAQAKPPKKATASRKPAIKIPSLDQFQDMADYLEYIRANMEEEIDRRTQFLQSLPHLHWAGAKYSQLRTMASNSINQESSFNIIAEKEDYLHLKSGDPDFFQEDEYRGSNLRSCLDAVSIPLSMSKFLI